MLSTSVDGRTVDISNAVGLLADDILAADAEGPSDPRLALDVAEMVATAQAQRRGYQTFRDDAYYLPNDAIEQKRLDLQHEQCLAMLDGKLHLAPCEEAKKVVDLCTGTGIWAIQYAREHPEAEVVGVDITKIVPETLPSNFSFALADVETATWLAGETYDFIHIRYVWTAIKNMKNLLQSIYDHLEPGGWYETMDSVPVPSSFDGTSKGSSWETLLNNSAESLNRLGVHSLQTKEISGLLRDIGFVDIVERTYPLPFSSWPSDEKYKLIGSYMEDRREDTVGMSAKILSSTMGAEEIKNLYEGALSEILSKSVHGYMPVKVIYARKPQ